MRIHHFYPRTKNIGDHFVQRGIAAIVRSVVPETSFELFDVNCRGQDNTEYGLTRRAIERANKEADLIIVGGSNLYEGDLGWPWGVHLDTSALHNLRIPLFLIGIGTGSNFCAPLPKPSRRAKKEIRLLNEHAMLSGVRDLTTLRWLKHIGINNAELLGEPATFTFNAPPNQGKPDGHILITIPPRRVWSSKRGFWRAWQFGRPIFHALVDVARTVRESGKKVIVTCNDPLELPLAQRLFAGWLPSPVMCPSDTDEYFELLSQSRAVIAGRLHTAAVALALGIPFLLFDIDYRTQGFIETYQLDHAALRCCKNMGRELHEQTEVLLGEKTSEAWIDSINRRDQLYNLAKQRLTLALESTATAVR